MLAASTLFVVLVYKKIVETGKDKYIYKLIIFMMKFRSVYKELHADHETGAADNK